MTDARSTDASWQYNQLLAERNRCLDTIENAERMFDGSWLASQFMVVRNKRLAAINKDITTIQREMQIESIVRDIGTYCEECEEFHQETGFTIICPATNEALLF